MTIEASIYVSPCEHLELFFFALFQGVDEQVQLHVYTTEEGHMGLLHNQNTNRFSNSDSMMKKGT